MGLQHITIAKLSRHAQQTVQLHFLHKTSVFSTKFTNSCKHRQFPTRIWTDKSSERLLWTEIWNLPQRSKRYWHLRVWVVIQRNKRRHFAFTKIVHSQLNTMSINKIWTKSSDICPVCYTAREDWYHNLTCTSTDFVTSKICILAGFSKAPK